MTQPKNETLLGSDPPRPSTHSAGSGSTVSDVEPSTSSGRAEPLALGPVEGRYRPRERFWPYVDLPEQLTDEEIAALDPDLHAELFGTPPRPLSVTIVFPVLESADYSRAVELARASAEYRETGSGPSLRHRARFWPADAVKLRDLFEIVGRFDACEVLVDDRPLPYARELWLPLIWFLIPR
jgi:hypothetical protein